MTQDFNLGGCARKLSEDKLEALIHSSKLTHHINRECAIIPGDPEIGFTIDSLFPLSNDPYEFARMATVHSISDLNAKNFLATSISVSLTLPLDFSDVDSTAVLDGISDQCSASGLSFGKGHTVVGEEFHITIAAVGTRPKLIGRPTPDRLAVVMTKPLGASRLYRLGNLDGDRTARTHAFQLMIRDHQQLVRDLSWTWCDGADVSGFGLASALISLARHNGRVIRCKPTIAERCDSQFSDVPTTCEVALNRVEAERFEKAQGKVSVDVLLSLFGTEVAGPLLWLVAEEHVGAVISGASGHGLRARPVGVAERSELEKGHVLYEITP